LILFGGFINDKISNELLEINLEKNTFKFNLNFSNTKLKPAPRYGHSSCLDKLQNNLFICGGINQEVNLNDLWQFSFAS
jgi:hypothetical protein